MHSLPIFVRLAGRQVVLVGKGDAAAARRRVLVRAGAVIVDAPGPDTALAFVAEEDVGRAEAAATALKARGLLLNVTDRPELCDFTMPAIVDRDPVLLAIGTGGASAGLAKVLRQRIEALLPGDLGSLATALSAARAAMRAKWPDGAERRRALDAALRPGGRLDPLGDARDVAGWLQADAAAREAAVRTITLASADPDDLTLRQARWLGEADRLLVEGAVPPAILARVRADAVRIAALPETPPPGLTVVVRAATGSG